MADKDQDSKLVQPGCLFPEATWAGTERSLQIALDIMTRGMQPQAGGFQVIGGTEGEPEQDPWMLSRLGPIGVIRVNGPLMATGNWLTRMFQVADYDSLREAAVHAAEDESLQAILLDVSSGGGAVSGLFDTAELLAKIDAKVKPIYTFASGDMASAAYALGVSARKVYASRTSSVGSIGIIATHKEYSEAMKKAGIGVTVVRSGEFKALTSQYEPLSDKARAQLQAELDGAYEVFIEHVASQLGMSVEAADKSVGQGREFFGKAAAKAGLVDGIDNFDGVVSKISAKLLDNGGLSKNNPGKLWQGRDMSKRALTEQQIAAMASGAPIDAEAAAAALAASQAEAQLEAAAAEAAATAEAAAAAAEKLTDSKDEKDGSEVLAFVQGQLREANAAVLDLNVRLAKATEQLTAQASAQDGLVTIAGQSLTNMRVALGLSAVDAKSMSVDALLTEHASASESFKKQFKAGGLAAVSAAADQKAVGATSALLKARLDAVRPTRK